MSERERGREREKEREKERETEKKKKKLCLYITALAASFGNKAVGFVKKLRNVLPSEDRANAEIINTHTHTHAEIINEITIGKKIRLHSMRPPYVSVCV